MRSDGSELTQLSEFDVKPRFNPRFSPDGKTIVTSDFGGTVLFDFEEALENGPLEDDDVSLVGKDEQSGLAFIGSTWSPDGEHLLGSMSSGDGDIPSTQVWGVGQFNLETNEYRQIDMRDENGEPITYYYALICSPDGRAIFLRTRSTIYKVDIETGETVVLARDIRSLPMHGLSLTPDGESLYLDEEVGESNIWISRPQD